MSRSSEMHIAEMNRNENKEAIKLIEQVQLELIGDRYDLAEKLEDAIKLMVKYSDKNEFEILRWK